MFAHEAVACDHPAASQAGAEILAAGGNAVDAAVAASFALSVVRPESCGIGGGGFMIIHLATNLAARRVGRTIAIDYREWAPCAARAGMFESLPEDASRFSGHAVALPGTVAGLLIALEQHGTLSRDKVLAPAIRLAREGWAPDRHTWSSARTLARTLDARAAHPLRGDDFLMRTYVEGAGARAESPPTNALIRNEPHAIALEQIARHGRAGFYEGVVAGAIVETVRQAGGILPAAELRSYGPRTHAPLRSSFRGRTVLTMPLPSSGGITLLEILAMVEYRPDLFPAGRSPHDPQYIHALAEMFKLAFDDRAMFLGDPEFSPDPTWVLLNPDRLRRRAASIDPRRATRSDAVAPGPLKDDAGTSHLCVVDRHGNAVACTETINLEFGSRICVPEFGFCLNNEMDDFQTRPGKSNAFGLVQSNLNAPAPGKRPLSSMTPTIVLDSQGRVELVIGASGGPRIITGVAQVILNALLSDMGAAEAVAAPRIHHQWLPDLLCLESPLPPEIGYQRRGSASGTASAAWPRGALKRRRHTLHTIDPIEESSAVQLIRRSTVGWEAECDPRKGGAPAGR